MFFFSNTRRPDYHSIVSIEKDYDDYWKFRGESLSTRMKDREKIIFDWIKNSSSVLDIGAGNSRLAYELQNKKNCKVIVSDVSSAVLIDQDKHGIQTRVLDLNGDFRLEGHYDYIVMSAVLGYLMNPELVVQRLRNHTSRLIVAIPNFAFYRYRLSILLFGRFPSMWTFHPSEHLHYWSHTDFMSWITSLGYRIEEVKVADGFHIGKNLFKNLFGHHICYLLNSSLDA